MLANIRSLSQTTFRAIVSNKVQRNFLYLVVGDLGSRALQFLSVIYLARVLTDARYGLVAFALTLQAYLLMAVDFGLPTIGTRQLAQRRSQEGPEPIVARIVLIRGMIGTSLFFLSSVLTLFFVHSDEAQWIIIGTFAYVICQFLSFDWVFQGFERMFYIGAGRFAFQLFTLGSILALVHGPADVIRVPLIRAGIGLLISLVMIGAAFRLKLLSRHRYPGVARALRGWKKLILEVWPIGGAAFLGLVMSTFDMLLLGVISRPQVVGWYSIATSIFFVALAVAEAMLQAFFPRLAATYANQSHTEFLHVYRRYWQSMLLVGLLCTSSIALLGPTIIRLFFGASYSAGATALQILMAAAFISFINHVFGGALLAVGLQRIVLLATGIGALVSIVGAILLVPMFSLTGAALSHVIAELSSALIEVFFLQRFFRSRQKSTEYAL